MRWKIAQHAWRELPPADRALRVMAVVGWVAAFANLWVVGGTETAALRWPTEPDTQFHNPHQIKGRTRYFSDHDDQVYRLWRACFPVTFGLAACLMLVAGAYEKWLEERHRKASTSPSRERQARSAMGWFRTSSEFKGASVYILTSGIKKNPERRWALPDRIFFGYGACHILSGVYLELPPLLGFYAELIFPFDGLPGNHIYVTDGVVAFDYHGYSLRERLLAHHIRVWCLQREGWSCEVIPVDISLLSTADLNERKMLGPDQYLHDAAPRARAFIERRDPEAAATKARLNSLRV